MDSLMRRWVTPLEAPPTGEITQKVSNVDKMLLETSSRKLPPVPGNNASQSNYNTIDRIKKGD